MTHTFMIPPGSSGHEVDGTELNADPVNPNLLSTRGFDFHPRLRKTAPSSWISLHRELMRRIGQP